MMVLSRATSEHSPGSSRGMPDGVRPREQRTSDHANFDIFRVFPVLSGAVRGTVGPSVKWSSNASPPSRRAPDPDRGRSCQSSFERDCQPAETEPGAPEAMSDRLGLERP